MAVSWVSLPVLIIFFCVIICYPHYLHGQQALGSPMQREPVTVSVGGDEAFWTSPAVARLPLTYYQDWSDSHSFFVNDTIYFQYNNTIHDVTMVETEEELKACNFSNPFYQEATGSSLITFFIPSTFYVMSSKGGINGSSISKDCQDGMKFQVRVHPLTGAPAPVSVPEAAPLLSPRTAPASSPASSSPSGSPALQIEIPWQPQTPNFFKNYLVDQLKQHNQSFLPVDSSLVFKYVAGEHNVLGVNQMEFDKCIIPRLPVSSYNDPTTPIHLFTEGVHYFIDGLRNYCSAGNMKLSVQVGPTVTLSPEEMQTSGRKFPVIAVAVPSAIVATTLVLGLGCCLCYRAGALGQYKEVTSDSGKNRDGTSNVATVSTGQGFCKVFPFEEIQKATNDFSSANEVGRGGFGVVYKGILDNGTIVAVKKSNHTIDNTDEFMTEVSILSQVNNRNLVRLIGCCMEEVNPLLVFEFISNGTLQDHLSKKQKGDASNLNWSRRFKIALQTAEALKYLHSQASHPIFHRDIKSANILLDENFNAKVADFGLSKRVDLDSTHVSTMVKGTPGYLDPDYFQNCLLTDKSDVYSYGVVLLELITSKRPIDPSKDEGEQNLAVCSLPLIMAGRTLEIVDTQLLSETSKEEIYEIEGVAQVAAACLIPERAKRPSMAEVVDMLQVIKRSKSAEEFLESVSRQPWVINQLSALLYSLDSQG